MADEQFHQRGRLQTQINEILRKQERTNRELSPQRVNNLQPVQQWQPYHRGPAQARQSHTASQQSTSPHKSSRSQWFSPDWPHLGTVRYSHQPQSLYSYNKINGEVVPTWSKPNPHARRSILGQPSFFQPPPASADTHPRQATSEETSATSSSFSSNSVWDNSNRASSGQDTALTEQETPITETDLERVHPSRRHLIGTQDGLRSPDPICTPNIPSNQVPIKVLTRSIAAQTSPQLLARALFHVSPVRQPPAPGVSHRPSPLKSPPKFNPQSAPADEVSIAYRLPTQYSTEDESINHDDNGDDDVATPTGNDESAGLTDADKVRITCTIAKLRLANEEFERQLNAYNQWCEQARLSRELEDIIDAPPPRGHPSSSPWPSSSCLPTPTPINSTLKATTPSPKPTPLTRSAAPSPDPKLPSSPPQQPPQPQTPVFTPQRPTSQHPPLTIRTRPFPPPAIPVSTPLSPLRPLQGTKRRKDTESRGGSEELTAASGGEWISPVKGPAGKRVKLAGRGREQEDEIESEKLKTPRARDCVMFPTKGVGNGKGTPVSVQRGSGVVRPWPWPWSYRVAVERGCEAEEEEEEGGLFWGDREGGDEGEEEGREGRGDC